MKSYAQKEMWEQIPLSSVPSQSLRVVLHNWSFRIDLQQRESGLYISLYRSCERILANRLCRDRTWLLRRAYLGVQGDLIFIDSFEKNDPDYTGLSTRYHLFYRSGDVGG